LKNFFSASLKKYSTSTLYKKITTTNGSGSSDELNFIKKVAQAYETFIEFLRNNTIFIDYTYLWDLVCIPNPNLFDSGVNLIILEIPDDDVTNNVELVCPTNHYSIHTYDARKRSLMLVKRDTYFEPIYGYRNDEKRILVTKTFSEYDRNLQKKLRAVFSKIIKPTLGEKCRTFLSKPNEYRFKQPPLLDNLITDLIDKHYSVTTQVLNFQGKVIGVFAKTQKGLEGFIPCFPSSLTTLKKSKNKKSCDIISGTKSNANANACEYDFVYMSDDIWKTYEETLVFLKEYYNYEEPADISKAQCFDSKYFCRVVEEELITGFLTNTNQFIQIKVPVPVSSVDDSIKTFTSNDLLVADINTLTTNNVDSKRVDFIKRIQLETNFYNVFRNTIRILFNNYSNSEKRKAIQDECNKRYVLYRQQLDKVIDMLNDLVGDTIVFATSEQGFDYHTINENNIRSCITADKEKCDEPGSVCRVTNDKCTLVLPKTNLVTNTDNETFYYGRMADELIRYNRIKSFIFKPQAYLSFGQVKYNLRDNEIIVLQDLLNQEFFENLVPADINKYAKYNTYDIAEPIETQKYNNDMQLDDVINPNHVRNCFQSKPVPISSIYWKNCFPLKYSEVGYSGSVFCGIYLVIDLMKEFHGKQLSVEDIKDDLIDEYKRLTDNFTNKNKVDKIIDILREEAQYDANQLQEGTMNFEQMIIQEGYMLVNFDLWILLVKYEIPSILISSKNLPESRFNYHEFVCYTKDNVKKYAFIVTPAMYRRSRDKIPEYKLIMDDKLDVKIDLDHLTESTCLENIEQSIINYYTIEDYIDFIFEKDITTKYKPKKKGLRDIEFVEIEEAPLDTIEPVKKKRVVKKIKPTIILEEEKAEEKPVEEENVVYNTKDLPELVIEDNEQFLIEPVKKKKMTRKQRERKLKVNPHGKKSRKANLDFEIVGDVEVV
jgi:hypothetical protein